MSSKILDDMCDVIRKAGRLNFYKNLILSIKYFYQQDISRPPPQNIYPGQQNSEETFLIPIVM